MIPAIIIMALWLMIGLYSITIDNRIENGFNVPFAIFMVMIPFFPWIFTACEVM